MSAPWALYIQLTSNVVETLPDAETALDRLASDVGDAKNIAKWRRRVRGALADHGEYVSVDASAAELVTALFRREFVVGGWLQ